MKGHVLLLYKNENITISCLGCLKWIYIEYSMSHTNSTTHE